MDNQFKTAVHLTELAVDLKERCNIAEKYLNHLKQLLGQANRTIVTLQSTSKYSLLQAKQLLHHSLSPKSGRHEHDRLMNVIDSQLSELDDKDSVTELDVSLSERIKQLESKHRQQFDNLSSSCSNKSIKCVDVDEKYPENWSRDSSIDLNNVINLPSVPEDVFSSFSSTMAANKPKQSSSLSSLKSMRKVKLFLQRAETSDDDEISSDDDHDFSHRGDSDDGNSPSRKLLGNITEESHFDTIY